MGVMKRFTTVLAAASLVFAGAACGGGDEAESGPVTLRYSWWGNADRAALVQKALDLFQTKNPNIKVTPSFQEFEAYWQKMATDTAGGNAPDVLQTDFAYLREYAERGVLHDLKKQEGENLDTGDLLEGLKGAGEVDDGLYAVPVAGNTWGYVYSPAAYAKAGVPEPKLGWTWADYRSAMEKITKSSGGRTYGGGNYVGTYYNLEVQLRQEGKQLYTEDGQLGFDKPRLAKFFNEGKQLADAKIVLPVEKAVQIKPKFALELDLIAGDLGWDNFMARYAAATKTELKLGPVPSDNPAQLGQYLKPSMLMSVSAKSKYPEQSAKLIDFFINDPEAGQILGANRGIPATNAQRAAVKLEGPFAAVAAYEESIKAQLEKAPPAPPKGAGTIEQAFIRISEELQYGRISVDQAVDQFFTEAAETLES
jgi:multiple sugar transport system substrate-binding protein